MIHFCITSVENFSYRVKFFVSTTLHQHVGKLTLITAKFGGHNLLKFCQMLLFLQRIYVFLLLWNFGAQGL